MKMKDKNIHIITSKKKDENKVSIILENELTIFSIEKIKDKIIEAVLKYEQIDFELKDVNNMDLTFIQLLYSVKKTAKKLNKEVTFDVKLSDDIKLLFSNSDLSKAFI